MRRRLANTGCIVDNFHYLDGAIRVVRAFNVAGPKTFDADRNRSKLSSSSFILFFFSFPYALRPLDGTFLSTSSSPQLIFPFLFVLSLLFHESFKAHFLFRR